MKISNSVTLYSVFIIKVFFYRYAVFFRGYRVWLILTTCWTSCLVFSTIVSVSEHTSIWLICDSSDNAEDPKNSNWTLPLLKFTFLFMVPVILIGLIYSRIYLEARASSEKIRKSSRFRTYSGSKESLQSLERSSPASEASQSTSFILMSSIRRRVLAANQFMLVSSIFVVSKSAIVEFFRNSECCNSILNILDLYP